MLSQHTKQVIKRRKQIANSKRIVKFLTVLTIIAFVGLVVGSLIIARTNVHSQQVCENVYHLTANCK